MTHDWCLPCDIVLEQLCDVHQLQAVQIKTSQCFFSPSITVPNFHETVTEFSHTNKEKHGKHLNIAPYWHSQLYQVSCCFEPSLLLSIMTTWTAETFRDTKWNSSSVKKAGQLVHTSGRELVLKLSGWILSAPGEQGKPWMIRFSAVMEI